jgi:glycosyltransferase involved in cell wall biosynthesis
MGKIKIIHLFPTANVYSLISDSYKPDVILDQIGEKVIGIWQAHWANLMCCEILKITDKYEFEIWQPDHRAEKIYEHKFNNGIIHKLFPFGTEVNNPEHNYNNANLLPIINYLNSLSDRPIIHLHEFGNFITQDFLSKIDGKYKIVLLQYGGFTFFEQSKHGKNIFRRCGYLKKSFFERKVLKKVDHAIVMNEQSKKQLEKVYKGPISFNNMGIDFSIWSKGNKNENKKELNIRSDTKIILSASMLRQKKQIDKLIKTFLSIEKENNDLNYNMFIVGGGDKEYEKKLFDLADPLIQKGKMKFLGRLSDVDLLKYYRIADLFVLVSSGEGSPVSVMKAHACGVPVLTTNFGQAPEIFTKNNCGYVINNEYRKWVEPFIEFIKGKLSIKTLDYEVAYELYDWKNVSKRFINIYKMVNT